MAVHHKVLNDRPRSARFKRKIEDPHKYEAADKKNHEYAQQDGKNCKEDFQSVLEDFILFLLSMRVEEKLSDMTSESSVSVDVNYHVNDLMQKLLNDRIRQLASR